VHEIKGIADWSDRADLAETSTRTRFLGRLTLPFSVFAGQTIGLRGGKILYSR
jgi:hypothetical protein